MKRAQVNGAAFCWLAFCWLWLPGGHVFRSGWCWCGARETATTDRRTKPRKPKKTPKR